MNRLKQNALTIITHIKPDEIASLNQLLTFIGDHLSDNQYVRYVEIGTIHFTCWVIIAGDPVYLPSLVFEVNYDGAVEDLYSDLIKQAGPGLDAIYGKCIGYPAAGVVSPEEVKRYLRPHAVET